MKFQYASALLLTLPIVACQNDSAQNTTEVSFDLDLAASYNGGRTEMILDRAVDIDKVVSGELQITNENTGDVSTQYWSVSMSAGFEVESNKTVALEPGTYSFDLLLTQGDYQYVGESSAIIEDDTQNTIDMTIAPVYGQEIVDVEIVETLVDLSFVYNQAQLDELALTEPKVGINVDGLGETTYNIDPTTAATGNININLPVGDYQLDIHFYDGVELLARNETSMTYTLSSGADLNIPLEPLHAEVEFNLSQSGSDLDMTFNLPSEISAEVGGVNNLSAIITSTGDLNTVQQNQVMVVAGATADTGTVTLTDIHYDELSFNLAFFDATQNNDPIGNCDFTIDVTSNAQTTLCQIELRTRSVVSSTLMSVVGVNVFDYEDKPYAGVSVLQNSNVLGVTGTGDFGTEGYLKAFVKDGEYKISADDLTYYDEQVVDFGILDVKNVDLHLNSRIDPTIVSSVVRVSRTFTYANVDLNGMGNSITVAPGESVSVSFDYGLQFPASGVYCPGCIVQAYVGIKDNHSQCYDNSIRNNETGSETYTFTAPTQPGIYPINMSSSLQFNCIDKPIGRTFDNAIAVIEVLAP